MDFQTVIQQLIADFIAAIEKAVLDLLQTIFTNPGTPPTGTGHLLNVTPGFRLGVK